MSRKLHETKQRKEQEATAHVFQEFLETFQEDSRLPNKLFIKSSTVLCGAREKVVDDDKKQIYNPKPLRYNGNRVKKAIECAKLIKDNNVVRGSKGIVEKPKSNLEELKEELKLRHRDRLEKNKSRCEGNVTLGIDEVSDQTSTNLFIANLNPKMNEQDLIDIFGVYGPLASVKIMWPRGEERGNTNVGFVAYMSRQDGERALNHLKSRTDMRIRWGKAVEIPSQPVHIPPLLQKLLLPPPQSGLPFNAQPRNEIDQNIIDKELKESVVIVTIPFERKVLSIIHRTIEFVVREGPLFEAMLMSKEVNNPSYMFLFDNKSADHIYYRWKLYSILRGESQNSWSTKEFRMFKDGSVWRPPLLLDYAAGMPEVFFNNEPKRLSDSKHQLFVSYIENLTLNRSNIANAMVFCMYYEEASEDVMKILVNFLGMDSTDAIKKISCLYLISDVLYNSRMRKVSKTSPSYIEVFDKEIERVFKVLTQMWSKLTKSDQNVFKSKVLEVIRAWNIWKIYDTQLLDQLSDPFLKVESVECSSDDEPLDGKNLIRRSLLNTTDQGDVTLVTINDEMKRKHLQQYFDDFVPLKWEAVSLEDVRAQAVSVKEIYDLERQNNSYAQNCHRKDPSKRKRDRSSNVELPVVRHQNELERECKMYKSGSRVVKEVAAHIKNLISNLDSHSSSKGCSSDKENCIREKRTSRGNYHKKERKTGRKRI